MYKLKVNGKEEFDLDPKTGTDWSIEHTGGDSYHIIKNSKSFNAEIVDFNKEEKLFKIKVNNNIYAIEVKDKMDLLLEKLGMSNQLTSKVNEIKAPMPGLVLEIKVQVGDELSKGDPVLILEAMKMENMIKAPGEGIVKSIEVKTGEAVEKNQVMIHLA